MLPPSESEIARPTLAAVILAGGASSRMGEDKAFLEWEGKPLLQRQIECVRGAGATGVWISGLSGVDYAAFGCPVLHDPQDGAGPLAGLLAALRAANGKYRWLLALAVDLPGMTQEYLTTIVAEAMGIKMGVIPQRGPYFEPLAAVYPVELTLAVAEAQFAAGRYALQELAAKLVTDKAAIARCIIAKEKPLFANWNDRSGPQLATEG